MYLVNIGLGSIFMFDDFWSNNFAYFMSADLNILVTFFWAYYGMNWSVQAAIVLQLLLYGTLNSYLKHNLLYILGSTSISKLFQICLILFFL